MCDHVGYTALVRTDLIQRKTRMAKKKAKKAAKKRKAKKKGRR